MAEDKTNDSNQKGTAISTNAPVNSSNKNEANATPVVPKYEEIHFVDSSKPVWNYSLFTEEDTHNFQNGIHYTTINLATSN